MPWSPYPPCRIARVRKTTFDAIVYHQVVLVLGPVCEIGSDHPYAGPDPMHVVEDIITGRRELAAASVLR